MLTNPLHRVVTRVGPLAVACALAGCSVQPIQPGMDRAAVIARMGTPTRVLLLAGGTRLQYSRQPSGQQAYMVDLDAGDHVVQVRQVLVAAEFARIAPGSWTRDDVERAFGPPASIDRVANWPHDILTYRWFEVQDMFYWVYLDGHNRVQRTEQGIDYRVDTRD